MEPSALSYWSAGPAARLLNKLAADLDATEIEWLKATETYDEMTASA